MNPTPTISHVKTTLLRRNPRQVPGCSTQTILVKLTQVYGFCTGANVPASHVKGPFSVKRPDRELQPGPPLNHMVISSEALGLLDGKNLQVVHKLRLVHMPGAIIAANPRRAYQKNSCRVSFFADEMGRRPAYDSPTSNGTSGILVPSTTNSTPI